MDLSKRRACNACELSVLHEVRIIQHVERFHSELNTHRFRKLDVLQHSHVDVEVRRSVDQRTADVASLARLGVEKHLSGKRPGSVDAVTVGCAPLDPMIEGSI